MKYLNRKETMATLFALIGFAVAIQNSLAQTQSTMQVSKQEFVDMSLNMAEKANIKQAKKKRQYESSLRETMSDEEFNKHQSETQKKRWSPKKN